jgi:uncharacterized membrane protein
MGRISAQTDVPGRVEDAEELWYDVRRWPTFVDGFASPQRLDDTWPAAGAKLVWQSVPGGRGVVTEKVIRSEPAALHEAAVFEERLDGTQTVTFVEEEEGTRVELVLDYNVRVGGPLRPLVDALFIRRAQNDALRRTLRRFATEAAEQAAL